jgi:hypothetical protein
MKVLGIDITNAGPGPCTGRPGILQQMHEGKWVTIARRGKDDSPKVYGCEHEALFDLTRIMKRHCQINGVTDEMLSDRDPDVVAELRSKIPPPDAFRYTFVDEDITDVEVKETTDAASVLSKLMEKRNG